ncbi:MAG: hypothetical protein LBP80_11600 [Treponema sp.]|jgi:hypothetical protein|nr:hypothetical protein [Treponema sp.]
MKTSLSVFRVPDFLFIGVCVAGAFAALFFFWRDLNVTMSRLAGEPVGVVSYKYRAAQRRFVDRVLWDRLKQESPVYNGDFIRTAELAEATISFFAGDDQIMLEGNTLIQILASSSHEMPGYRINLAEGGVSAEVQDGAVSISSGDTVIEAAAGSVVQAATASTGTGLDVAVLEGSALVQAGTEEQNVAAGETFTTRAGQSTARVAVLSPRPQAKFLNNGEAALPVSFEWTRLGFNNNDPVRLEIAGDRSFTRVIKTVTGNGNRAAVDLTNGVYYWRVYPERETEAELEPDGVSGRLVVVYAPPPHLISPARDERFSFKTARPGVRFQWTAGEGATAYLIEVAANADMQNAVYRSNVQATGGGIASVVYAGLEPGIWYWRVRPVYPRDYEGAALASQTASFIVERAAELATPEIQDRQSTVYLERQGESYFSWKAEDEAAYYTFLLSRQENLRNPLIQERVRNNYHAFDVKAADLVPGQYYWGVYQTDSEGNNSNVSAARTLVVMAGTPPARATPIVTEIITPVEAPVMEQTPEPAKVEPARPVQRAASPSVRTVQPVRPEIPVPLATPQNLQPAAGYTLTEEIIIRDRRIAFNWDAVTNAAEYTFTLFHVTAGNNTEVLRQTLRGTSYTLTDLTLLEAGHFVWRVEAVNENTGKKSAAAESRFVVDIPEVEDTRGQDTGVLFGTD